jgi:hypothetical protein
VAEVDETWKPAIREFILRMLAPGWGEFDAQP